MVHYPRDELSRGLVGHWKLDDLKRVATDGIIAHYKMNDNAASTVVIDSKSGNNGVASANTDTFNDTGKINGALSFNNDVNINLGIRPDLDFVNRMSIAFWIKFDTLAPAQDFPTIYKHKDSTGADKGMDLFFINDDNKLYLKLYNGEGGTFSTSTTKNDWTLGQWYHIVVVWNNSLGSDNIQWYINGTAENSGTGTLDVVYGSDEVTIGVAYEGDLDDVRIYDRALSLSEVQTIYNSDSGTETTELFRDTVTAIDRANFNDGTITGVTNADGQNWKPSNSMSFDGVDDLVTADGLDNNDTDLTVTFKMNTPDKTQLLKIIAINGVDSGTTESGEGFYIRTFSSEKLQFLIGNDSGGQVNIQSDSFIENDIWYSIVCRLKDGKISIFVDGIQSGSDVSAPTTNWNFASTFRIGKESTDGREFHGTLQKMRVFNRGLTNGEISKLYRLRK